LLAVLLPAAGPLGAQSARELDPPSGADRSLPTRPSAWPRSFPSEVTEALEAGRFWAASKMLEEGGWDSSTSSEGVLAAARMAAGWRNWSRVVELLDAEAWLAELDGGSGLLLLGRAREAREEWDEAANVYLWWLTEQSPERDLRVAVTVRLARTLAHVDRGPAAVLYLDALLYERPFLTSWARLEAAEILAPLGDTSSVPGLVARITDPVARDRARFLSADALLEVGDTLGAMDALLRGLEMEDGSASRSALAWSRLGGLRLATADATAAVDAFREALALTTRGTGAIRSARRLLDLGEEDPDRLLRMADALRLGGEQGRAVRAYARWMNRMDTGPEGLPLEHRLRRARILDVAAERTLAIRELRELGRMDDPEIAAPALTDLARIRRRQGRTGDRRSVENELVERFPQRPEAVDIVFFRADASLDAGNYSAAMDGYSRVVDMAPSLNRAGFARMRWGQIHLHRREYEKAAAVFEGYLADFPEGRRLEEAMYWAGSALLSAGNPSQANEWLEELRRRNPVSYYTVMAGDLLGLEYSVPTVPVQVGGPTPDWVILGLASLDLLRETGLETARSIAKGRLIQQAEGKLEALVPMGEGLNARGDTWEGLNLGLDARRLGLEWDVRLLRIVYPFPDSRAVFQEAVDRDVDPWLVAGVIRQESAFNASAVSSAGAVGMMQVMPATGKQLARALGPEGFTRETLFNPEVNVHLGSAFLYDLMERFGPEAAHVLVAYNAGPTRIQRWRKLPEAEDPIRFTERIPFEDTRGYVKAVKRNRALYRWLYGEELSPAGC